MPKRISAVLLAAGSSRRFGSPKQLSRLGGLTLIERALDALARSRVDETIVVLGHGAEELRSRLAGRDIRVVVNKRFAEGLSTSLQAGIGALAEGTDAVLVVLADQPLVTPKMIDSIIERYVKTGSYVVTSASGGVVSPPVIFDRSVFDEIMALKGDIGAKSIILKHADSQRVEVPPGLLVDIDTKEDAERVKKLLRRAER